MVTEPLRSDVCADIHRFSKWCEQRDASRRTDNFEWFSTPATDALLAAENLRWPPKRRTGHLLFGTTLYTARDICHSCNCPTGDSPDDGGHRLSRRSAAPENDRCRSTRGALTNRYKDYTDAESTVLGRKGGFGETVSAAGGERPANLAQIFTRTANRREDNVAVRAPYFDCSRSRVSSNSNLPNAPSVSYRPSSSYASSARRAVLCASCPREASGTEGHDRGHRAFQKDVSRLRTRPLRMANPQQNTFWDEFLRLRLNQF